jgi:tetratricopeptide (TPR) repeat protein
MSEEQIDLALLDKDSFVDAVIPETKVLLCPVYGLKMNLDNHQKCSKITQLKHKIDLINLARKGDVQAITTLINNVTEPKSIATNVLITGDCLQLLFESQEAPKQEVMVTLAKKMLGSLKIDFVCRVKLYGRKQGDLFTVWEIEFEIEEQNSEQPNLQPSQPQTAPPTPIERRLDIIGATTIVLGSTIKPIPKETNNWPEGFWDHFNIAESYYDKKDYQQAKDAYIAAHSLLNSYARLNAALLRTYRKIYKSAIDEKRLDEAYKTLYELFNILSEEVTDTDRRQLNKVVDSIKKTNPDFSGHGQPLLLNNKEKIKPEKPTVKTESASGIDIGVFQDETYDNESFSILVTAEITPNGFVAIEDFRIGYPSTKYCIRTYTKQGGIVSETDLQMYMEKSSPFRMRICSTGEYLLGYSEELQLTLWILNGNLLAEQNIRCDEIKDIRNVGCVAISGEAKHCLFTSRSRVYLLDQFLQTHHIYILPKLDSQDTKN